MSNDFNLKINRKNTYSVKWLKQKSSDFIPFWVADSDYNTTPEVIDRLTKIASNTVFGYTAIPDEFNNAIVNWYKRYDSLVDSTWISPCTGVVLGIRIILDIITKENDGVILQTPVYHTFHHLINGMNRRIIENKLIRKDDTYVMDFNNLEKLFKEGHKVLILCSPHNPVGRLWTKEELEQVKNLALKYDADVISDEIHSDINITNRKFYSMINFDDIHHNLYVCNAPSKAFNIAGLSTSYLIIPDVSRKEQFDARVKRDCISSPTIFGFAACIEAYKSGEQYICDQNKHILNNYLFLKDYINKNARGIIVSKLEGTYLVWLDLSVLNKTNEEIQDLLDKAQITCSNGVGFCNDYGSFIRVNIACPIEQLKEGLERFIGVINEIR